MDRPFDKTKCPEVGIDFFDFDQKQKSEFTTNGIVVESFGPIGWNALVANASRGGREKCDLTQTLIGSFIYLFITKKKQKKININ